MRHPGLSQGVMVTLITMVTMIVIVKACDEVLCASLVSKCLLLKSCECNMADKANCTCCKDCSRCLSKLYIECCDCVGMCRSKVPNHKQSLALASSIEELQDPIPELFMALTDEQDPERRWTIYTYPAHLDLLYFNPPGLDIPRPPSTNTGFSESHEFHHVTLDPDTEAMNCTVAYHSQCMSLNKCRASCESMGAARYRWFHQYGCCECIGSTCLDYGKGEPLCIRCSSASVEVEDSGYYYNEYYEEYNYGGESYGEEVAEEEEEEDEEDYEDEDEEEESLEKMEKNNFGAAEKHGAHAVNTAGGPN